MRSERCDKCSSPGTYIIHAWGMCPNGGDVDLMEAYSAALDEIYALRRALAYEARVVEAQTLDISRLGKNRREHLERAIERMQHAARGAVSIAYAGTSRRSLESCMEHAGGSNRLTRSQWEASLPTRRGGSR